MRRFLFLICALSILGSCVSFPFDSSEESSWVSGDREKAKGTVKIISVSAEILGGRDSLEKEINVILPLLFWEEGYVTVPLSSRADYSVEAAVREREYADGWRTKRSLSAELRLWAEGRGGELLPLSAGRALVQGKQSIASSKTLDGILRKAVQNCVWEIPHSDKNNPHGEDEP